MNTRNFPAHGELSLKIDGRLLSIEGEGPGNMEVVLQYQRDVQGLREQLAISPWASLVKLKGVPLLPPEAKGMMIETIKQAKAMNLVATAVVLIEVEFSGSVMHFWESIYQQADLKYDFFEHAEDAKAWLNSQIDLAKAKNTKTT